jgi:hypothetical protein
MNIRKRVLTKKIVLVVACLTLIGLVSALTVWQWTTKITVKPLEVETNLPQALDAYSGFTDTYTTNVTNLDSEQNFTVTFSCWFSIGGEETVEYSITPQSETKIVNAGQTITFTVTIHIISGEGTLIVHWQIRT